MVIFEYGSLIKYQFVHKKGKFSHVNDDTDFC